MVEKEGISMNEELMRYLGWVRELLNADFNGDFSSTSVESIILHQLRGDWRDDNGIEAFRALEEKYGDTAKRTISEFLKVNIQRDWVAIGKKEAHDGTEIDDFFHVLWEPLRKTGFEYERKVSGRIIELTVTRCPVFELAKQTGMHDWFYRMACMSDYFTTPSFSSKIGFTRTKTLMQEDGYCNHTYYYKDDITDDMLLGFCGLFCGSCPNFQQTDAVKPVQFNKEDFYEPCTGCVSGIKTTHCASCTIMECNKSRNTRMCYDCTSFPCTQMDSFIHDERYPYHKHVETNMRVLKNKGLAQWVAIQQAKNVCRECNSILNFFETKCSNCGSSRSI